MGTDGAAEGDDAGSSPAGWPGWPALALLAGGSLAYLCFLFVWFLLPAFLGPVTEALGLSGTEAGIVAGAVPLSYVPLALASGLVVDRIGPENAVAGGLALLGAASALRAGASDFLGLLAPTLLLGVGGTGITFGLPRLVADLFPPTRTGAASSVYVVGASLGTAAAFGIGRPVLGPALGGWRPLFRVAGVAVVAVAAVWLPLARALRRRVARTYDDGDPAGFSLDSLRADAATVLSHPALRLLVLVGTMRLFVVHGLQAWLATLLEVRGLAAGAAATVTSLLVVARIGGTLTVPALSDRAGLRRPAVIGCGALATLGTLGVVAGGASLAATVAAVALVGLGIGGLAPLVRAIPVELDGIGPRLTATANGLIFTVGEVGGFSGPFLIGGLSDLTGSFLPGLLALALGAAVVVVAGRLMAEPGTGAAADGPTG